MSDQWYPPQGSGPPGFSPPGTPPAGPPPGYHLPHPAAMHLYAAPPRTSGLAVASMVLGILWLWWVGSLLAIIFGHVAISQTSQDPRLGGRGMAIAGLTLGYVGLGFFLLFVIIGVAAA
jgi:hypothetical protein